MARKMYRFRNASGQVVRLDLHDGTYDVDPGADIDLPDSMVMKRPGAAPGSTLPPIIELIAPQMMPAAGVKVPDGPYYPPAQDHRGRQVQRVPAGPTAEQLAAEEARKQAAEMRKRVKAPAETE
jgi:hypothetical protein